MNSKELSVEGLLDEVESIVCDMDSKIEMLKQLRNERATLCARAYGRLATLKQCTPDEALKTQHLKDIEQTEREFAGHSAAFQELDLRINPLETFRGSLWVITQKYSPLVKQ